MYDNKPLSALPVENVAWKAAWLPDQYQTGPGVLIEGFVRDRSRHAIVDTNSKRTRYTALYVSVRRAHRRRFDASGVEIESYFTETEKVPVPFDYCTLLLVHICCLMTLIIRHCFTKRERLPNRTATLTLAKQSACIVSYYRGTWNVMERTAYI